MSDLLKLNNIAKRNGDIRMFPLDNIKSAQTGKNGWGQITIAINKELSKAEHARLKAGDAK